MRKSAKATLGLRGSLGTQGGNKGWDTFLTMERFSKEDETMNGLTTKMQRNFKCTTLHSFRVRPAK